MQRKEFISLLKTLEEYIKLHPYTNGSCLPEWEIDELYSENIHIDHMNILYESPQRWYIPQHDVYLLYDYIDSCEYYIMVNWNCPSTERQAGQETNCEVYEVVPKEKTIITYEIINEEE